MTQTFTNQDLNELFYQAHTPKFDGNGKKTPSALEFVWPTEMALGYNRVLPLRPGLQIWYETITPQINLNLAVRYQASDPFGLIFVLGGDFQTHLFRGRKTLEFCPKSGFNILGYGGTDRATIDYLAGQAIQIVQIVIEPWLMEQFVERNPISLPIELHQILQGDRARSYAHFGETNPVMQMALHQLWHCPYQGLTQQIYLEGKALELLALKLNQLDQNRPKELPKALKPQDIDYIHQAKSILLQDIENPPSLMELARAVGLNDHKLKQGFRHVFGTTVFGCLHDYRMETARQMLQTHDVTVAEVAYAVGFSNRSHFAAAFKRRFDINPKAYLIQNQRERSR